MCSRKRGNTVPNPHYGFVPASSSGDVLPYSDFHSVAHYVLLDQHERFGLLIELTRHRCAPFGDRRSTHFAWSLLESIDATGRQLIQRRSNVATDSTTRIAVNHSACAPWAYLFRLSCQFSERLTAIIIVAPRIPLYPGKRSRSVVVAEQHLAWRPPSWKCDLPHAGKEVAAQSARTAARMDEREFAAPPSQSSIRFSQSSPRER